MKHTRKMLMIPEMEYQTLINMLKNKDELGYEKSKIDTKIDKTLKNPKLNELVKGKKYDWLIKQQSLYKKQIAADAEKPKNVILDKEQIQSVLNDISKYLGVAPTKPKKTHFSEEEDVDEVFEDEPDNARQSLSSLTSRASRTSQPSVRDSRSSFVSARDSRTSFTDQPKRMPKVKVPYTPTKKREQPGTSKQTSTTEAPETKDYIFHPDYYNDMAKIMKQNSDKLKIAKNGQILDNEGNPIEGSNYKHSLDFLTGKNKNKPTGTDVLIDRMKNEKYYTSALDYAEYHRQRGEGLKLYKKTKGLIRKKPNKINLFKPTLWVRL